MASQRSISRLSDTDWDFAGQFSESQFSAIHWHPSRYASQLPAVLIGRLSDVGSVVLDPFAGSGTTLVEAQRLGRQSIGIDVNPIACLMGRAKILPHSAIDIRRFIFDLSNEAVGALSKQLRLGKTGRKGSSIPATVQADKWYAPEVRAQLSILWECVRSHRGPRQVIGEACFSAILLKVCRETRHWGYVCDNSTPKTDHAGDVLEEYTSALEQLGRAYDDRDAEIAAKAGKNAIQKAEIYCGSLLDVLPTIPERSIDLIVTSPPYYGVTDYIKAQRLSMEWFGYEIEPLRQQEIGARSKRHRATATREYVRDMEASFTAMARCLRPGGACAVVIGESAARTAVLTRTREAIEAAGLELKLDLRRRVSPQRRQTPSVLKERIFVFVA